MQIPGSTIRLTDVYQNLDRASPVLFKLLQQREDFVNISHRRMPTWAEHMSFINSRPYPAWYLIENHCDTLGAIYLSALSEIGVFILKEHAGAGHGRAAISTLIKMHPKPRYLANINPRNQKSLDLFQQLGFKPIQHTLELLNDQGLSDA